MAEWQGRMRTEVRDRYFYYSAVFGSEFIALGSARADEVYHSPYILHDLLAIDILLRPSVERSRVGLRNLQGPVTE